MRAFETQGERLTGTSALFRRVPIEKGARYVRRPCDTRPLDICSLPLRCLSSCQVSSLIWWRVRILHPGQFAFRKGGQFPDCSGIFRLLGMVRGFSRFVPFLFLGLLGAPTRNSPEWVRDTIWTFPAKSGKPPGLETPRFSFSQYKHQTQSEAYLCSVD